MRHSSSALWAFQASVCWLAAFAGQTTASPVAIAPSGPGVELQPRGENNQLRIMPLGASITAGFKSIDKNGYRKTLFDRLEKDDGWKVDMVGSLHDGDMKDNAHEGHVGYRVDQFDDPLVDSIIKKKPNLILINLGTNDATQKYHVNSTGDRMDELLTKLYDGISGTTIILSTLLPNDFNPDNVKNINAQYRRLVSDRRDKHDSIVLAEMSDLEIELQDGTHPTTTGYHAMTRPWFDAITKANLEGLIKKPVSTSTSSSSTRDNKAPTEAESSPPSQSTSVETSGAVSRFPHKRFWTWFYTFV